MEDAKTNQNAEDLATLARKGFLNKNILDLATNLANKHKRYTICLASLHKLIVRMFSCVQTVRQSPAMNLGPSRLERIPFTLSTWLTEGQPIQFKIKVSDFHVSKFLATTSRIMNGFWHFLQRHQFAHNNVSSGITWVQLFLLVVGHIPNPLDITHQRSAAIRKSIHTHVRHFRHEVLQFVRFALTPAYASRFKATTIEPNRLCNYGYITRWTHISCYPILEVRVVKALDLAMLNLNTKLTRQQRMSFDKDELVTTGRKLKGHGRLSCPMQIRQLRVRLLQHNNTIVLHPRVYFPIRRISFFVHRVTPNQ